MSIMLCGGIFILAVYLYIGVDTIIKAFQIFFKKRYIFVFPFSILNKSKQIDTIEPKFRSAITISLVLMYLLIYLISAYPMIKYFVEAIISEWEKLQLLRSGISMIILN